MQQRDAWCNAPDVFTQRRAIGFRGCRDSVERSGTVTPLLRFALMRLRPNGLAFRCRERAGQCLSKSTDLAREAVSCNAGLGGYGVLVYS